MASYSERMHRRSMTYALCGLLFACLAAALIVTTFRHPIVRTVVVETPPSAAAMSSGQTLMTMETRGIRGNRRHLLQSRSNEVDATTRTVAAMIAPSSLNNDAAPNPTPSPIVQQPAAPTPLVEDGSVVGNKNDTTATINSTGAGTVATESIAAAMVGVASSIIICALGLYCSDLRERRRYEKWNPSGQRHRRQERDQDVLVEDDNSSQKSAFRSRASAGESMTSVGSTHEATSNSGHWTHGVTDDVAPIQTSTSQELVEYQGGGAAIVVAGNPQNMLPPMLSEDAVLEDTCDNALALTLIPNDDASISRVSTLTMSLKEGGYSYGGSIEEKLSRYAIESSSEVTELDDAHRVSDDTKLTSLVKGGMASNPNEDASVCSSLTNGSQNSTRLLGEECLDAAKFQHTPDTTPFASLEVSPDTPLVEEYDKAVPESEEDDDDFTIDSHELEKNELVQLEQLLSGIPNDEMSQGAPAPLDDTPKDTVSSRTHLDHVRAVCFVPVGTQGKIFLGLELLDAASPESFPTVLNVESNSPLEGQLFIGEAILSVNEQDTIGLSSRQVMELVDNFGYSTDAGKMNSERAPKMITFTIIGSYPGDDDESLSDGQMSLDLNSATEV